MAEDDGAPVAEPAESESTLEDDLSAAFEMAEAGDEDNAGPPGASKEASPEPPVSTQAKAGADDPEPQAETDADEAADDPEGDEEGAPEEEPASLIQPPDHWSASHKESFSRLDAEGREFFMDRHGAMEADNTRKSQELSGINRAFEPFRTEMDLAGLNMEQGVTRLLAAHKLLQESPEEGIKYLADQYGVDIGARNPDSPHPGEGEGVDDEFLDDMPEDPRIAGLEKEVLELKRAGMQENERRAADARAVNAQRIAYFRDGQDEKGVLFHPHYEAVKGKMNDLAISYGTQGRNDFTLESLYEEAVWMVPGVREQLNSAPAGPDEEEVRRAKVKRAKSAGAAPRGRFGSPVPREVNKKVPDRIDDHLEQAFAAAEAASE